MRFGRNAAFPLGMKLAIGGATICDAHIQCGGHQHANVAVARQVRKRGMDA